MDLPQIFIRAKENRKENWKSHHKYLVTEGQPSSLPQGKTAQEQETPALLMALCGFQVSEGVFFEWEYSLPFLSIYLSHQVLLQKKASFALFLLQCLAF